MKAVQVHLIIGATLVCPMLLLVTYVTILVFYLSCSCLGFVMDQLVLQYHWQFLKSDVNLKTVRGLKTGKTAYGMVFNTKNYGAGEGTVRNETREWATFLTGFFYTNKDNENILVSLAQNNLTRKVSV